MRTCFTFPIALVILSCLVKCAAQSVILDDLESRLQQKFQEIAPIETVAAAQQTGPMLRTRIKESLGLDFVEESGSFEAHLFRPKPSARTGPAIILALSKSENDRFATEVFVGILVRAGITVLRLPADLPPIDKTALYRGIYPQTVLQSRIRTSLTFLSREQAVDPHKVILLAPSISGMVGGVLNPELAGVILTGGLPDIERAILTLRNSSEPDKYLEYLIPGLGSWARTSNLLALIAPRPLLTVRPVSGEYVRGADIYSMLGTGGLLEMCSDAGRDINIRTAIYSWLNRRFEEGKGQSYDETDVMPPIAVKVNLPDGLPSTNKSMPTVSRHASSLDSYLGPPLPEKWSGYLLPAQPKSRVVVTLKPFTLPSIVLRPGIEGQDVGNGVLLAVADEGKDFLLDDHVINTALRQGRQIWMVDVRGLGEMKANNDAAVLFWSAALGENFVWRQAFDLRIIMEHVQQMNYSKRMSLYGKGPIASLIALYVAGAASGTIPEWIALDSGLTSFGTAQNLLSYAIPASGRRAFDIPDLIAIAMAKGIKVKDNLRLTENDW